MSVTVEQYIAHKLVEFLDDLERRVIQAGKEWAAPYISIARANILIIEAGLAPASVEWRKARS